MNTVQRMTAIAVIGVLLAAGVACASDDTGSPELRQAVASQVQQELSIDDDQADCFAGGMIGIYGPVEMEKFVDDPENYIPSQPVSAEATQKVIEDCDIKVMELVEDRNLQGDAGDIPAQGTTAG